jgi:hypothetical protein
MIASQKGIAEGLSFTHAGTEGSGLDAATIALMAEEALLLGAFLAMVQSYPKNCGLQ